MTDILCKWLNDELNITQQVGKRTLSREKLFFNVGIVSEFDAHYLALV